MTNEFEKQGSCYIKLSDEEIESAVRELNEILLAPHHFDDEDNETIEILDEVEDIEEKKTIEDYLDSIQTYVELTLFDDAYSESLKAIKCFPFDPVIQSNHLMIAKKIGMMATEVNLLYDSFCTRFPINGWSKEVYDNIFDYLLLEPSVNRKAIQDNVSYVLDKNPFDENCYMVLYRLEKALGNWNSAVKVLEDSLCARPGCHKAAKLLVEEYMHAGQYQHIPRVCDYGICACTFDESSNMYSFFVSHRIAAKTALLLIEKHVKGDISEDRILQLEAELMNIMEESPIAARYGNILLKCKSIIQRELKD